MKEINVTTEKKKQVLDITARLEEIMEVEGWKDGVLHATVLHTTAALTTADLDPGTDLDYLDAFEHMVPKLDYRHPHNPAHAGDHIMASLIGPSIMLPVRRGKLVLGLWQKAILVEFDGPKKRDIAISFINAD